MIVAFTGWLFILAVLANNSTEEIDFGFRDWLSSSRPAEMTPRHRSTYIGGSKLVFIAGRDTPGAQIDADPVRWEELKYFVDKNKKYSYNDDDLIYEYSYKASHADTTNSRYFMHCFCFPSKDQLCSCDDPTFHSNNGLQELNPAYIQYIEPSIFYMEEANPPDDRFMNLLNFHVYINGTFPHASKKEEIRDYKNWQVEGNCYPEITKNCRRKKLFLNNC